MGHVATEPMLSRGSPTLPNGDKIRKGPQRGPRGYITPTIRGVPNALERGTSTNGPQENFGSLRHAAACFKLLVKGTIIFRK